MNHSAALLAVRELARQIHGECHMNAELGTRNAEEATVRSPRSTVLSRGTARGDARPTRGPRSATVPARNGYRWNERPRKRPVVNWKQPRARKGEVRLVDFKRAEAARCGVSEFTVYERIMAGKYPGIKIRRPHRRFVFVLAPKVMPMLANEPLPGEIALKDWAADEAGRCGVVIGAIYNKLSRGKYPGLEFRRVNQRVVFVKIVEPQMNADLHRC